MKAGILTVQYLFMTAALLFIDRITKCVALVCFSSRCTFNEYLSFELAFNRGISWSFFHSSSDLVFVIVSSVIACVTAALGLYTFMRWYEQRVILGELWVLVGSVSNIIDRIMYRGVIDFIEFSYGSLVWPLFNFADVCIVVGVGMMLFEQMKEQ